MGKAFEKMLDENRRHYQELKAKNNMLFRLLQKMDPKKRHDLLSTINMVQIGEYYQEQEREAEEAS